jgi:hypothetical protein
LLSAGLFTSRHVLVGDHSGPGIEAVTEVWTGLTSTGTVPGIIGKVYWVMSEVSRLNPDVSMWDWLTHDLRFFVK